jgi:Dynein heavy chain, N-terminal region 1.
MEFYFAAISSEAFLFMLMVFVWLFCLQVRNLKNLGFRVPLAIVNKAHQANQLYPFAISLIESVRTYERTLEKVISPLLLLTC